MAAEVTGDEISCAQNAGWEAARCPDGYALVAARNQMADEDIPRQSKLRDRRHPETPTCGEGAADRLSV
jgi:hypothetical protein